MSWWILFTAVVVLLLVLDLTVLHRRAHVVSIKESLLGVAFWVGLAAAFNVFVYFWKGHDAAMKFLAGYVIEESLSVDNLFVFLVIFSFFRVPEAYRHRVLFWGILGALVMRAIFIVGGIGLIHRFHWIVYVFGAFLIFTAYKLVFGQQKEIQPEKNPLLKAFRKVMPVTEDYEGSKFFVKKHGRWFATPLMVVLLAVETTDVIFAVDSIPAVLSISKDPFIVYTSNVFAILGLRALFFALAGLMHLFHYLNLGLGVVLAFVGVKMLIEHYFVVPITWSLSFIAVTLTISILASIVKPPKNKTGHAS
jgi:tellurite resistance protein TerC